MSCRIVAAIQTATALGRSRSHAASHVAGGAVAGPGCITVIESAVRLLGVEAVIDRASLGRSEPKTKNQKNKKTRIRPGTGARIPSHLRGRHHHHRNAHDVGGRNCAEKRCNHWSLPLTPLSRPLARAGRAWHRGSHDRARAGPRGCTPVRSVRPSVRLARGCHSAPRPPASESRPAP